MFGWQHCIFNWWRWDLKWIKAICRLLFGKRFVFLPLKPLYFVLSFFLSFSVDLWSRGVKNWDNVVENLPETAWIIFELFIIKSRGKNDEKKKEIKASWKNPSLLSFPPFLLKHLSILSPFFSYMNRPSKGSLRDIFPLLLF